MKNNQLLPFIKTQDADITDDELKELLNVCFEEIKLENITISKEILDKRFSMIINKYKENCKYLEDNYVVGKIDTFKRASCLMTSCYEVGIFENITTEEEAILGAILGTNAALKWIQKPYCYIGKRYDEKYEMQECNFDDAFDDNQEFIEQRKINLIKALLLDGDPILDRTKCDFISKSENLHFIYESALITLYKGESYGMNIPVLTKTNKIVNIIEKYLKK